MFLIANRDLSLVQILFNRRSGGQSEGSDLVDSKPFFNMLRLEETLDLEERDVLNMRNYLDLLRRTKHSVTVALVHHYKIKILASSLELIGRRHYDSW